VVTALALRDYQLEALAAVEAAEQCGMSRQLITLQTGTGKTIVFYSLCQRRGGRALALVHRHELTRQAVSKFKMMGPAADLGVVKAGEDQVGAQTVVVFRRPPDCSYPAILSGLPESATLGQVSHSTEQPFCEAN
jgi:superfamily II DNA or RNA helicase